MRKKIVPFIDINFYFLLSRNLLMQKLQIVKEIMSNIKKSPASRGSADQRRVVSPGTLTGFLIASDMVDSM